MIWEDYERYLKYLRELEKKNSELGKKIQIDTMRIDFLQKEGECKQIYKYKGVNENEEESLSRITELNTFLSFLSMKLDEIEELLDVDSTSIDQVKELYAFFEANKATLKFNLRDSKHPRNYHSTS